MIQNHPFWKALCRNQAESYDSLRKGFEELNLEVPEEEIREAVEELDGIVGWLTLYGYN
ncbi:hypothetical protein [Thermococcus chitonophagus]|uniref:Uncharacterized protein n=1 Tax=Thermococcus chitonophagus TaxID=54262 RepID=A0A160VU35_9EURY|nr:hypothetical protein [Thermococcus chitonophagus]CUX77151.1 hypothetical protein CHITON_0372 [Thermococcus chitonophagus]